MKRKILFLMLLLGVTLSLSCELDGFLFNTKKIDKYELPGNTIPDSLIEEVAMESGGNKIYGFWIESGQGDLPNISILYCHGNKHHIDEYWDRVMYLHRLGVRIFIYDYRGYGRSEGKSSEKSMHEDAEAALEFLLTKESSAKNIVFYGYSLGNVASIYLAAEKFTPRCLIAECPFASANSLTQGSSILDLPAQWLTTGKFDNAENIKQIKTPLLLLHGGDDDFIRYRDNGKVVYDNAPEPKSVKVVPGADHTDIPETMGVDNYLIVVEDWIKASE